jgi:Mn-dependent DtxR family transcriptional regulator
MCVSKTAVHKALTRLKRAGLVEQDYYGQALLTEKGFACGQELCKRHQYLLAFLTKELGIAADIAERDACRMEHAISDESFEKWMAYIDERGLIENALSDFDALP